MAALGPVCCRGVDVQAETAKEGRSVGSWRRRQLLQLSNSWLLSSSSPPSSPSANCREKMTTLEEETMMAAEAGVLGQNKRSDLAGRDGQTKKAEEKLPNPPDACTHCCCCCCRCGCILAFPATAHNPEPSASSRPAQTDGWGLPVVVAADVGSIPMGCVQGKSASSVFSPPLGLEKLKLDHGYVGGVKRQPGDGSAAGNGGAGEIRGRGNAGDDVVKEGDASIPLHPAPVHDVLPPAPLGLEGGKEEMVEGWPLWLLQNIPREALVKFVPRSADDYIMIEKVGQGTYSNVYKAWERETGKIVALKKVRFETSDSESVRFMAREIMVLQELDHPNIVKLEGLATSRMNRSLYLVFEFMYSDLARILSHRDVRLTEAQVKCYMQQLLSGLEHCHNKGILHRDIKGSNLLIDKDGRLKIADFGLANYFSPDQKYPLTSRVVTLWYRAPELILGATDYGVGIDLWSAGCLLAEMLAGRPILPGRTEIEQLHRIFKLCGSPSEDYFKRFKKPTTFRPPQPYIPSISETFKYFPPSSLGLLTSLLALEPSYRCSASAALQNEFFRTSPLACDIAGLPVIYKVETDEWRRPRERRKSKTSKSRRQPHIQVESQQKAVEATDCPTADSGSSKEEEKAAALITHNQELGSSTRSASSSQNSIEQTVSPPSTGGSAVLLGHESHMTDCHPSATKNIENLPPLLTSKLCSMNDGTNNSMLPRLGREKRNASSSDFRRLVAEKMLKHQQYFD